MAAGIQGDGAADVAAVGLRDAVNGNVALGSERQLARRDVFQLRPVQIQSAGNRSPQADPQTVGICDDSCGSAAIERRVGVLRDTDGKVADGELRPVRGNERFAGKEDEIIVGNWGTQLETMVGR